MTRLQLSLSTLVIVLLFACSTKEKKVLEDFSYDIINASKKNLKHSSIQLETLVLDTVETSFTGFFHVEKDTLRYLDKKFGWLFMFDQNGKYMDKSFGRGGGPNEIPSYDVMYYDIKSDDGYFFLGGSWDGYNFDSNNSLLNKFQIKWPNKTSIVADLKKKADPTNFRMYSFDYDQNIVVNSNTCYIPLQSQSINFNLTHDSYFSDGRLIAKLNIQTGEMTEIFGRRPPIYDNNKRLRLRSSVILEDHPKGLMYTFESDSSIYVINEKQELIDVFGFNGKNMNQNFPKLEPTQNVDDMRSVGREWRKTVKDNGFYTSLKHFPSKDLTLRTYQKGITDSENDGLQIYKGGTLIGDVDVPRGFKIAGYSKPYFYSDIITKEEEILLKVYRFTID